MRHRLRYRRFSRCSSHRVAMLANMAVSLVRHERVCTTVAKAKDLRPFVERLVTIAKRCSANPLHGRRLLISRTKSPEAAEKLLGVLASRYGSRDGGYTRILRNGFRKGDCAPVAIIEFLDRDSKSGS